MTGRLTRILATVAFSSFAMQSSAAVALELKDPVDRTAGPRSLSGITYAGGDTFYAVADEESSGEVGLYKLTITTASNGSITSCKYGKRVPLALATDAEAVAFDPATGHVWVSNETGATAVREYDPETGAIVSTLDLPAVYQKGVYNYWIEGLTISGDGLTLWLCNEESLTCDGSLSSASRSATVRISKFCRPTIRDRFVLAGQYAYVTDRWRNQYDYEHTARRGVAGLCALPDGTLLVLERELSYSSTNEISIFFGASYLGFSIYAPNFTNATDIRGVDSLASSTGWTPVAKGSALAAHGGDLFEYGNYEGICLGQEHSDGRTSVLLLSDAGDGYSEAKFLPALLSGLRICTMDFPAPVAGAATFEGKTYRFVGDSRIRNVLEGLPSASPPAYTNRGEAVEVLRGCAWEMTGAAPASGSGAVADFTVGADGTFYWRPDVETTIDTASALLSDDSFERHAVGTGADAMAGWTGDGEVVSAAYDPPMPPGYPLSRETHTNVFHVSEQATRTYADAGEDCIVDLMCAADTLRMNSNLSAPDCRMAIASDASGILHLYCATGGGTVVEAGWVPLPGRPVVPGEWRRVTLCIRGKSDSGGFVQVRLDGSPCPTPFGFKEPDSATSPGSWHRLVPKADGAVEVNFIGTGRVDDLVLADSSWSIEHAGATETNGVPYAWFNTWGLSWDPDAPLPGKNGYAAVDGYVTGIDPYSDRPFSILRFDRVRDGVSIVFNGSRPDPEDAYCVEVSDGLRDWTEIGDRGKFTAAEDGCGTIWMGTGFTGEESFFRVRAVRPKEDRK